jgi:hypothetical protein
MAEIRRCPLPYNMGFFIPSVAFYEEDPNF